GGLFYPGETPTTRESAGVPPYPWRGADQVGGVKSDAPSRPSSTMKGSRLEAASDATCRRWGQVAGRSDARPGHFVSYPGSCVGPEVRRRTHRASRLESL